MISSRMEGENPEEMDMNRKIRIMQEKLSGWGKKHLRDYPWRRTGDPYRIMIAEIMLHRTKADQVKKIYENFLLRYPDFKSISRADPETIRRDLHSLGLQWRADLLHEMATDIVSRYNGKLPAEKEELMTLPGAGPYISSAVLCFGYNLPEPVLDTNTVRVIGRVFGLKITDGSRRNKKYEGIMKKLVSCENPRFFSLSMIDFASLVCRPGRPDCTGCPLREICHYHEHGD